MARDFISLQVRFYDDTLLDKVRVIAQNENRSVNAQILAFLKLSVEEYFREPSDINNTPINDQ